jgi:hypothetical protein
MSELPGVQAAEVEPFVVVSGDDFIKEDLSDKQDRWGDWVLNLEPADNPSLDYVGGGYRTNPYWISLEELQTWQGLNHWMHHLNGKIWGQKSMGDFVNAVMSVVNLPYPGVYPFSTPQGEKGSVAQNVEILSDGEIIEKLIGWNEDKKNIIEDLRRELGQELRRRRTSL